jgi:hypothetical protein
MRANHRAIVFAGIFAAILLLPTAVTAQTLMWDPSPSTDVTG